MATNLKKIIDGLQTSVDEYENIQPSSDLSKKEALEIITKETALISNVEKREHDQKIQDQEYELKKDHQYFVEGQDKERLKIEKDRSETDKKRVQNEENRAQMALDLELKRFNLEKERFDNEVSMQILKEENDRKERMFRYASLAITAVTTMLGVIIPVLTYRKLALLEMWHTYQDEGRTRQQYNEFVRGVKPKI